MPFQRPKNRREMADAGKADRAPGSGAGAGPRFGPGFSDPQS